MKGITADSTIQAFLDTGIDKIPSLIYSLIFFFVGLAIAKIRRRIVSNILEKYTSDK